MKRPNIILIITDQQRYDTIRAELGFPYFEHAAHGSACTRRRLFRPMPRYLTLMRAFACQPLHRLFPPQLRRFEKQRPLASDLGAGPAG